MGVEDVITVLKGELRSKRFSTKCLNCKKIKTFLLKNVFLCPNEPLLLAYGRRHCSVLLTGCRKFTWEL